MQVANLEGSTTEPEENLLAAQRLMSDVMSKESELTQVEEFSCQTPGLESPTTLDAKASTLRGKWKEVNICLLATSTYRVYKVNYSTFLV